MVYTKNGVGISTIYNRSGQRLTQAYDIDENELLNNTIRVMTYNIGQWYIGNGSNVPSADYTTFYNLQRLILSTYAPDVVGFQEYYEPFSSGHTVESVIGDFFTNHANSGTSGYPAKATYTKGFPISDYTKTDFTASSSECYTKGKISVGGKEIWILNAHLATSSNEANKVAESTELLNVVSGLQYFVILADFNTVCKSVSDTEYITIMKQFIDAGYHSANCSQQHGFIDTWTGSNTAGGTWYPCDQIITSANINIETVIAGTIKISVLSGQFVIDHIPLVADLTIN